MSRQSKLSDLAEIWDQAKIITTECKCSCGFVGDRPKFEASTLVASLAFNYINRCGHQFKVVDGNMVCSVCGMSELNHRIVSKV